MQEYSSNLQACLKYFGRHHYSRYILYFVDLDESNAKSRPIQSKTVRINTISINTVRMGTVRIIVRWAPSAYRPDRCRSFFLRGVDPDEKHRPAEVTLAAPEYKMKIVKEAAKHLDLRCTVKDGDAGLQSSDSLDPIRSRALARV